MRLQIENFAKLLSVDISLNGLTVIAGPNNTGKSTIGKVLYALFRGQSNIERRIREERVKSIREVFRKTGGVEITDEECTQILELRTNPTNLLLAGGLRRLGVRKLEDLESDQRNRVNSFVSAFGPEIGKQADSIRTMSDNDVSWNILLRVFTCVFHNQFHPLKETTAPGKITLTVKRQTNEFVFGHDHATATIPSHLFAKAFLLSDPGILSLLNIRDLAIRTDIADAVGKPSYELAASLVRDKAPVSVITEANQSEEAKSVLSIFDKITGGSITLDSDGEFVLKESGNEMPTKAENLSMGLKALVLLRTMIERGVLSKQDILVLDEPEVHLHPSWQLIYAKAIVELQKTYDLTVLVTTHSPYFLRALDVYSREALPPEKIEFYLSGIDEPSGRCTCRRCSDDLNPVFKSLYEPFAELM